MAAVLSADAGDVEKIAEIISECQRMNIEVLPPDVNESLGGFTVIEEDGKQKIRFGLYSIKNFGNGIADSIIAERKKGGHFKNIEEFLLRNSNKNLNKKSLEALIMCGAMDNLEERGILIENLENLLTFNREANNKPENQDSLFGLMEDKTTLPKLQLREAEEILPKQKLEWEKDLLGLYVSGHPLDEYKAKLRGQGRSVRLAKERLREGMLAGVTGLIDSVRIINTKRGDKMAFVRISDYADSIEVVVFPKKFTAFEEDLTEEVCVHLEGRISKRNGDTSIILETCKKL